VQKKKEQWKDDAQADGKGMLIIVVQAEQHEPGNEVHEPYGLIAVYDFQDTLGQGAHSGYNRGDNQSARPWENGELRQKG
jgi:hypothetical protein